MTDQRLDQDAHARPLAWAQLLAGTAIFGSGTPVSKIVTEGFSVAATAV